MASSTIKQSYLYIVEQKICDSVTISAGASGHAEANIAKNGYKPIGIVGIGNISASNLISEYSVSSATNKAYVYFTNLGSSSLSGSLKVSVLYEKLGGNS